MAALGVLMTIEKMTTTPRFSHAIGVGFAVAGLGVIAMTLVQ
jgi:hypothetical protein